MKFHPTSALIAESVTGQKASLWHGQEKARFALLHSVCTKTREVDVADVNP